MMETDFASLLLMLILAVNPRYSSANVIAAHDGIMEEAATHDGVMVEAPADSSSPTVNNMIAGIQLLTNTFEWLQENMLSSQRFGEAIDNLENDISDLPSELVVNRRQILEALYKSQDRFNLARSVLNQAAMKLISHCDELVDIIDTNDVSERLLKYTARLSGKQLRFVNGILRNALNKLIEINNDFSVSKVFVLDFNATLSSKAEKIKEKKQNEKEILRIIEFDLKLLKQKEIADKRKERNETLEGIATTACVKVLRELCPLAIIDQDLTEKVEEITNWLNLKEKLEDRQNITKNIERLTKLEKKIEKSQESTSELFSQVARINDYIETESDMINIRQKHLDASILDYKVISNEKIESKLNIIKSRINVLKNACTSYINI